MLFSPHPGGPSICGGLKAQVKRALVSVTQDVELRELSSLWTPVIPLEKEGEKLSKELCIFHGVSLILWNSLWSSFWGGSEEGCRKSLVVSWVWSGYGLERDLLLWVMPLLTHLTKVMQDVHAARLSHWTFFGIASLQIMKWRHY